MAALLVRVLHNHPFSLTPHGVPPMPSMPRERERVDLIVWLLCGEGNKSSLVLEVKVLKAIFFVSWGIQTENPIILKLVSDRG